MAPAAAAAPLPDGLAPDGTRRYWLGVFGDPDEVGHVAVEGGMFGHHRGLPESMAAGDVFLCYCTGTYRRYARSVPGLGVISTVDHANGDFAYDYRAFVQSLPASLLRFRFTEADRWKLGNIRWDTFWLFEVSAASFAAVMAGVRMRGQQLGARGAALTTKPGETARSP